MAPLGRFLTIVDCPLNCHLSPRFLGWGSLALGLTTTVFLGVVPATPAQQLPVISPPPVSYSSSGPTTATGEQYLVYINGNSPLLLEQVQTLESGAFLNVVDGRTVIQAGRFNAWENAQRRVQELREMGIGAEIRTVAAISPYSLGVAPSGGTVYPASVASSAGDLPPLPVAASPSGGEFGQPLPGTLPPPPSATAAAPPSSALVPGYYVVVPGGSGQLSSLANQIGQLGAPPNSIQQQMAPRGPHVAVGPFTERGLAEDWSRYLRGAGLDARVHRR
ncbi:hypothetical protein [Leptolyngbya sp. PCC 6406]|uniref:hypothetical protein n=1 Tax=Leptolyngbya sp. PCC 6406 TaxID=1173264 RepID=UPI0002F3D122|nr:hypothetical protein [Leptolyngbya sp. PCC 6406]